ncbi:unnamed protein product [Rotaria socialis]|uniref:G-protein coupled receptors family 1 profile domain-containing protein n=1 Tax=Rotaria socialis TaxID=392032 RepID=A0A817SUS2_9BILA|nr:unnamed protein product [Rotaria socialis]CAF3310680.1 unnamed protein product [Rotaria socialis]CAF3419981.1 unnamed protein product [Rotaria socialis]CAF4269152.1 unnamed protein product [Rotaria socialis]CAF4497618.1 unnamed protein product [Rotaria socialis]
MLLLDRIRNISLICLTAFGCAGNILTFIIVNRCFFRKTSSSAFISGLCIADSMVLCLLSFQVIGKMYSPVTSYDCGVFFFLDVFRLLSVWIICFINLERCSLVFNPCHISRLTSRKKAYIFVIILFIISLIIFSHYAKHMNIEYTYSTNQTMPIRSICVFKPKFHRVAWECIRSALTYWLTVPVCIICNIIIIKCLYHASRFQRTSYNNFNETLNLSSKQRQLTGMLVTSSICFVLTVTPSTIHSIYLAISKNFAGQQYIIHVLTNILLHFHHASNFLAFIFSCSRFRVELIDFFQKIFCAGIFEKWHKRSTATTEQMYVYSTRHQKTPIKLFTSKSNMRKRNNQNGIVVITMNNFNTRQGKNHGPGREAFYK